MICVMGILGLEGRCDCKVRRWCGFLASWFDELIVCGAVRGILGCVDVCVVFVHLLDEMFFVLHVSLLIFSNGKSC